MANFKRKRFITETLLAAPNCTVLRSELWDLEDKRIKKNSLSRHEKRAMTTGSGSWSRGRVDTMRIQEALRQMEARDRVLKRKGDLVIGDRERLERYLQYLHMKISAYEDAQ